MKSNSVLIISNDESIGQNITEKIKLLRSCDQIKIVNYIESISVLNSTQPSLIIINYSSTDSLNLIKEIRNIRSLNQVPIIFVMESFIEDILMRAFDNGIDDFFFMTDSDAVILMRIFLTLQKSILYKQIDINNEILVSCKIIDKRSGIYLREHASIALSNFFGKSIEENMENTIFMYVKPVSINRNERLNIREIGSSIKSIIRGNDIIAFGKNSGLYLILYNTNASGADVVINKIKNKLNKICKVYANAAEITASFEEMEPIMIQSLKDQMEVNQEFQFITGIDFTESADILNIKDENGKTFKNFKKEFYNSITQIITPVFEKIGIENHRPQDNIKLDYDIAETKSYFTIEKDGVKSELLITYPAYIKLMMDIKHTSNTSVPIIRRVSIDIEDFSEEKLTLILTEVIKEFYKKLEDEAASK